MFTDACLPSKQDESERYRHAVPIFMVSILTKKIINQYIDLIQKTGFRHLDFQHLTRDELILIEETAKERQTQTMMQFTHSGYNCRIYW